MEFFSCWRARVPADLLFPLEHGSHVRRRRASNQLAGDTSAALARTRRLSSAWQTAPSLTTLFFCFLSCSARRERQVSRPVHFFSPSALPPNYVPFIHLKDYRRRQRPGSRHDADETKRLRHLHTKSRFFETIRRRQWPRAPFQSTIPPKRAICAAFISLLPITAATAFDARLRVIIRSLLA